MNDLDRIIADLRGVANTHILREIADRLAALAKAAPDGRRPIAWVVETQNHGPCISLSDEFLKAFPNAPCDFIPHAPAKAREVMEADVERALRSIWPHEKWDAGTRESYRKPMRAALATFAEGGE